MAGPRIERRQRTVFYAPTANRSYLTLRAAANKEARAMMLRKYPTEPGEPPIDFGWHWTSDEKLTRVYERLRRRIYRAARKET